VSQDERDDSGWVAGTAKTVDEAVAAALAKLGLETPGEAVVEIVEEPQRGILGLGGRGAKVRARPRVDKAQTVLKLARDVLGVLDLGPAHSSVTRDESGYIRVSLEGGNLGALIGRRGETLDALQYLMNLAAARLPGPPERVILDAGGYRERRRVTLEKLAGRIAGEVRRSGQEMALEPMTPQERKAIHMFLSGEAGVRSESRGADPFRRIVVCPGEASESGEPEAE
jgi:spoIIIJ-associated protein